MTDLVLSDFAKSGGEIERRLDRALAHLGRSERNLKFAQQSQSVPSFNWTTEIVDMHPSSLEAVAMRTNLFVVSVLSGWVLTGCVGSLSSRQKTQDPDVQESAANNAMGGGGGDQDGSGGGGSPDDDDQATPVDDDSPPLVDVHQDTEPCGFAGPGVCASFGGLPDGTRFHDAFLSQWDLTIMDRGPEDLVNPNIDFTTVLNFCGEDRSVSDFDEMVLVCDGRLVSSILSDSVMFLNMRSRMPFDFAGREGLVTFSADLELSQRQWMEVWITPETPRYPGTPAISMSEDLEPISRAIRLVFDQDSADVYMLAPGDTDFRRVADGYLDDYQRNNDVHLNQVKIRLSETHIKVEIDGVQRLNGALPEALDWSRGYVIFQQFSYNPFKDCGGDNPFDCTPNTINWGYFGFDGPSAEVVTAGTRQHSLEWIESGGGTGSVTINHPTGGSGSLRFSALGQGTDEGVGQSNQVRINGGEWMTLPLPGRCWAWRTYSFPVQINQGNNTIEFRSSGNSGCFFDPPADGLVVHRVDLEANVQ